GWQSNPIPYTGRVRPITLLAALTIALNVHAEPPETEKRPYSYSLHGVSIEDPYHWLEGSDAPEAYGPDPALDAAVGAWTDAQNAYTRSVLDALPNRDAFAAELAKLLSLDSWGIPRIGGDRLFYSLRRGDQAQPVLYVEPLAGAGQGSAGAQASGAAQASGGARPADAGAGAGGADGAADAPEARVLLDVNALDPSGLLALDWFRPSPDGRL